ncbi:signal peptide peptidase SppA [Candidatus Eisenbacteria bacterium]|uniref:Signal peptide peptidase SppA n=1 Tax=Eiseniibacteriota bacterium TaxID=2212470 RepID=A0ABV6YIU2_UNCEI
MKSFIRSFFASFLALVVLLLVVVGAFAIKSSQKEKIDDHSYLVIDMYGQVLEYAPPSDVMGQIMGGEPETLQRILSNLEKAQVDDRIDGVILKLSMNNTAGYAMMQEVRGAIQKVRESGKKVYGFAGSMDRRAYMLAAACDSIFMPQAAFVSMTGFAITSSHIKETLEKLGIKPNVHKIKDYKAAAEAVTRSDMSDAVRENREWMLDEIWEMYIASLHADRGLSEEKIVSLMEHALFTAEGALEHGLIDEILYWDELEDRLKREKDDALRAVSQCRYADVEAGKLGLKGKKKIAVIHAQGTIAGRRNTVNPFFGIIMGHESIADELERARRDDDVAAVVFRIDSGGGESVASDLIGHAVELTAGEKPVVASMVDVAGSGGYHIAYTATKIMANEMSVTGSIGSISGKFNIKGFHDKLGITHDHVTKGPMGLIWSEYRDFTDEERARFEENHWEDFDRWLQDVAKRRGMTYEEAEKLAHGRVWSGRQAKDNGLIDEVGGLEEAIALAKELAEIPEDEKVSVVHYPQQKDLVEMIMSGEGDLSVLTRWALYRFIQDDLVATWNHLAQHPELVDDRFRIE